MKIAVIVATGFEDVELICSLDIWSRNKIDYELFSLENKKQVKGQNEALVECKNFLDFNADNFDALFLPGGSGHQLMLESKKLQDIIVDFKNKKKSLFAICAAPEVFKQAGVLERKTFTSYPGYAVASENTGNEVEVDGNMITGRDFEATLKFAKKIVEYSATQ